MDRRRDELGSFAVPKATRCHEMLMVKAFADVPVRDGLAGAGRVYEAAVACVNTHVIDVTTMDAKEHQVAR